MGLGAQAEIRSVHQVGLSVYSTVVVTRGCGELRAFSYSLGTDIPGVFRNRVPASRRETNMNMSCQLVDELTQGKEQGRPATMESHPNGDWCAYEDVEALEKHLCAARWERDVLRARIDAAVEAMQRGEALASARASSSEGGTGKLVAVATLPIFIRMREELLR